MCVEGLTSASPFAIFIHVNNKRNNMNDYVQQLKEYKKKTWKGHRTSWTESNVRTLLETGKCEGHSEASCNAMISLLRYNRTTRNKFYSIIQEFNEMLTRDGRKCIPFTKEETELVARHIVPFGREKNTCANYACINKLFENENHRQHWAYESTAEYEARTGKSISVKETLTETVEEPVKKEVVEVKTPSEFELHAEAIKTMVSGGMEVEKIMKLLNIDETTINAFMHLMTKYNF